MTHHVTIEIADEVYQPLAAKARKAGQSVEAFAQECLAEAVRARGQSLQKWLGSVESDVPDAAERHDEYLGQALADELQGRRDG